MFDAKVHIKKVLSEKPISEEDIIELVECLRISYCLETNWSTKFDERVKKLMSKIGIFKIVKIRCC